MVALDHDDVIMIRTFFGGRGCRSSFSAVQLQLLKRFCLVDRETKSSTRTNDVISFLKLVTKKSFCTNGISRTYQTCVPMDHR